MVNDMGPIHDIDRFLASVIHILPRPFFFTILSSNMQRSGVQIPTLAFLLARVGFVLSD
jgi:hypothetical protein